MKSVDCVLIVCDSIPKHVLSLRSYWPSLSTETWLLIKISTRKITLLWKKSVSRLSIESIDWLIEWTNFMILINLLIDWLIGWLIDWSMHVSIDWLIDWFAFLLMKYRSVNHVCVRTLGLSHEANLKKIRLLTFLNLCRGKQDISHAEIEKALVLGNDEVEDFLIEGALTMAIFSPFSIFCDRFFREKKTLSDGEFFSPSYFSAENSSDFRQDWRFATPLPYHHLHRAIVFEGQVAGAARWTGQLAVASAPLEENPRVRHESRLGLINFCALFNVIDRLIDWMNKHTSWESDFCFCFSCNGQENNHKH